MLFPLYEFKQDWSDDDFEAGECHTGIDECPCQLTFRELVHKLRHYDHFSNGAGLGWASGNDTDWSRGGVHVELSLHLNERRFFTLTETKRRILMRYWYKALELAGLSCVPSSAERTARIESIVASQNTMLENAVSEAKRKSESTGNDYFVIALADHEDRPGYVDVVSDFDLDTFFLGYKGPFLYSTC